MTRPKGSKNKILKRETKTYSTTNCNICKKEYRYDKRKNMGKYCSKKCFGDGIRGKYKKSNHEYLLRIIKPKQEHSREAYGITIPPRYVEKYNLLGKKFNIKISPKGKFILYTKVK